MDRPRILALATGAIALIVLIACLTGSPAQAEEIAARCCFANPRFTGVCEAYPTGEETCATILGYLNNPNTVGKGYCGGTTVRGGWNIVTCPETAATCSSSTPQQPGPEKPEDR